MLNLRCVLDIHIEISIEKIFVRVWHSGERLGLDL